MATVKRFEDLRVWQTSRELVNKIYDATEVVPFKKDFGLKDQIRRAVGSVMHNIAEGFGSGTDPEFVRFLGYARRSAVEVQSQLYIALDRKYLEPQQFEEFYRCAEKSIRQINALISYLHKSAH